MDLTSDLPFWTVRNGLRQIFPPLQTDVRCDALIVGGGISGALLSRQLLKRGVDCIVIDRRDIGHGSTSASTALLQSEIDTPLHKLRNQVGSDAAQKAYFAGLTAIANLQRMAGTDCGFALRPSLQIAARKADVPGLREEYKARRDCGFPVTFLERDELHRLGIAAPGALHSKLAAEVDPYLLTHRLFRLARGNGLRVFDRTTALKYTHTRNGVLVQTDRRCLIRCRAVFFATGYETQDLLPKRIVRLKSTYALVSEPVANLDWWPERSLIWGTGDPYLYMRTTSDNRVLVGGEDDSILNPKRRDRQIPRKTKLLLRRFRAVFQQADIEPAFSWAGVFGSTKDGLAYIGAHPSFPRSYFALGFGGNGITFSEIAARILADLFLGRKNQDAMMFRFDR